MGLPPAHVKAMILTLMLNCAGGCPVFLRVYRASLKKAQNSVDAMLN